MLRAVILGHDNATAEPFERLLAQIGHEFVVRSTPDYLPSGRLEPFLRDHAPNLVILCLKHFSQAMECSRQLKAAYPQMPILALGGECRSEQLLELMRSGIRELLTAPFNREETVDALVRLRAAVEKNPETFFKEAKSLLAFLPAQGGAGSSLVAANTAMTLSRIEPGKSLLVDCDIINGLSNLYFGGEARHSLLDIADQALQLDSERWSQLVTAHGRLDLISTGSGVPERRLEPSNMRHLLAYARRIYDVICLDVPSFTQVMIETLWEASRIFIVCTPEMHSLYLAREKYRFLVERDLGDRAEFVLNRLHRRARFSRADCEEILEGPVYCTLPNDYQAVQKAINAHSTVDDESQLGKAFRDFAKRILAREPLRAPREAKRYLEHFYVTPKVRVS